MSKDPNREARLARALRENLKRRKVQARDRDQDVEDKAIKINDINDLESR